MWQDRAACRRADPDLFFSEAPADIAQAKAICAPCPVRATCLAAALTRWQPWGIWGGTTTGERAALTTIRFKTCGACRLPLPVTEFWRHSQTQDGLQPHCKPCVRARLGTHDWAVAV